MARPHPLKVTMKKRTAPAAEQPRAMYTPRVRTKAEFDAVFAEHERHEKIGRVLMGGTAGFVGLMAIWCVYAAATDDTPAPQRPKTAIELQMDKTKSYAERRATDITDTHTAVLALVGKGTRIERDLQTLETYLGDVYGMTMAKRAYEALTTAVSNNEKLQGMMAFREAVYGLEWGIGRYNTDYHKGWSVFRMNWQRPDQTLMDIHDYLKNNLREALNIIDDIDPALENYRRFHPQRPKAGAL